MWQQINCFYLILSAIITVKRQKDSLTLKTAAGSLSVYWDMKVSPVVSVSRGEDAVLSCSFTHPGQQDYSGYITVKWIGREENNLPFFMCSVKNDSKENLKDCSGSGLKHSLNGDPRHGDLSLIIRKVHVADSGSFFCRVELDSWRHYYQKETRLLVTVKPQVLSLSVVEPSSGSTTRRLQCEVEGNPPPNITWLSTSRGLLTDHLETFGSGPGRLFSSVPYVEGEVFTCRVENKLGGAERRYPADHTLIITLSVCVVIVLLLCAGIIYCRRRVLNRRLQDSDSPAEGDTELQLVYSTVSPKTQHESLKSSNSRRLVEEAPVYSFLNIQ